MSFALTLGLYSLISNQVNFTPSTPLSEWLPRHELTLAIPAWNEEVSIGSKVLLAAKVADSVLVLDGRSTDRTAEVAALAGARVVRTEREQEAWLKVLFEASYDSEFVGLVHPECLEDFDLMSQVLRPLKNRACDISVGFRPQRFTGALENVFLLNGKVPLSDQVGVLAFSPQALKILNKGPLHLSFRALLSYAEEQGVRVNRAAIGACSLLKKFDGCRIGVVVPAYNEEFLIEETLLGVPSYVDRIYVINDGSSDRTGDIARSVPDPRIVYFPHEVNQGVGASIIDGYKLALKDEMDLVAVMAGDNQMDPKQLPRLLLPILEGKADYTKGNRLLSGRFRDGMSGWRAFGNFLLSMITKIGSGYWQIMDPQNGYTAISRRAIEAMDLDSVYPYYGYCNDLLIKLNAFGMRVVDVVMPARYGRENSSIKYGRYILKVSPMLFRGFLWRLRIKYMILDFHPLVFFYITGMILFPASVLFGFSLLLRSVFNSPFPAYYGLLDLFVMLAGIQMLLFGMLFDMQADWRKGDGG